MAALEPPVVVTTTLAVPAVPAGVVAVIDVALTTDTLVAAVPPILTVAPEMKLVPVMVTLVPPAVVPLLGLMLVTVGGALADICKVAAPPRLSMAFTYQPNVAPALTATVSEPDWLIAPLLFES